MHTQKQKEEYASRIEAELKQFKEEEKYVDVALDDNTGQLIAISKPGKMTALLNKSKKDGMIVPKVLWIETVYLSEVAVPGQLAVVFDGLPSPYHFAYAKPIERPRKTSRQ